MRRYSRLSLQGPKDVDSTKSGASEVHMYVPLRTLRTGELDWRNHKEK